MLRKVVCLLAFVAACDPSDDAADPSSKDGGNGDPAVVSTGSDAGGSIDAGGGGTTSGTAGGTTAGGTTAGGTTAGGTTAGGTTAGGTTAGGTTAGTGSTDAGGAPGGTDAGSDASVSGLEKFSFFVTSLASLRELSKSQSGFGGDLRFGETGDGAGLRGADKICTTIAEKSMPGSGAKQWRAFLSTSTVNAKDRIGAGPWYDRKGRLLAQNLSALLNERPQGADTQILNDFPNELGVNNHNPDGTGNVDNHDMLTGTNSKGTLFCPTDTATCTCKDWTSAERSGKPRVGHSWPRSTGGSGRPAPISGGDGSMNNWMSALDEAGCAPGVSLIEMGPPQASNPTVGSGGGYGGFYCFALAP